MLAGTFDPSLMFVMGGALLVTLPAFQWALRRSQPLCAPCFELPSNKDIDANLIIGALVFGAGWGGCCDRTQPTVPTRRIRPANQVD